MSDHSQIRFGLQVNPAFEEVAGVARLAEEVGFDVISVADHVGDRLAPPVPLMAQLLAATDRIKVGSLVLNNDMRNPVQLAWDVAWLQNTSGGRVELGLGAGHTPHEYGATGVTRDPASVRKARLAESVEIVAALFRGETVDYEGGHYQIEGAALADVATPVPILVGGNGTALLAHAARHADIIGLQGLGRTLADGHRHSVKFSAAHLEAQLAVIAEGASARDDAQAPELNALVQLAETCDNREEELAAVVDRVEGLTMEDAMITPYLAAGTVNELAAQFVGCRDRWGISYFTVRNPDWGPVIERVREID